MTITPLRFTPADLPAEFWPGNGFAFDLEWPDDLGARTFTATLGDEDLDVTIDGDTITISGTEAATTAVGAAVSGYATFRFAETTGGLDEALIVASWTLATSGRRTSTPGTVTVQLGAASVAITVPGPPGPAGPQGEPGTGGGSGGAVDSVNGQTGVVLLTAATVGADPAGTAATAVAVEAAARGAAVAAEATTRANADTALTASIAAEATARGNADTSEATARAAAVSAEASTRATADTALQANIDAEATARAAAVSAEASTRAAADTALSTSVTNEATARASAVTTEAAARAAADALLLPKAGGTMTGDLTLAGDPTQALHAATRQYVLARIADLVNSAPALLDTLGEIAAQLATDESAVAALTSTVAGKQPLDAELTALAALVSAADKLPYFTGGGSAALSDFTSFARSFVAAANASAARTVLGLGSAAVAATGDFDAAGAAAAAQAAAIAASQPLDGELTALAGLTSAADKAPYFTGAGAASTYDLTTVARSLLDDTTVAAMRATLGLVIGTDVAPATGSGAYLPVASPTFTGVETGPVFAASGLTGATQASRYVGATASGAPASGTFAIGDFVIDRTGKLYICTTAGSPGTWTLAGGSGGGAVATDVIFDAKGDLPVGTGADTAAKVTVGADGYGLVADSAQTAGVRWDRVSSIVAESHADSSVVNSTTETAVVNFTLPGGAVVAGDLVRLTLWADYLNNSGSAVNLTPKVKFGTTTVLNAGAFAISANANRRYMHAVVDIMIESTTAQRVGVASLSTAATSVALAPVSTTAVLTMTGYGTAAEDTSTNKAVQFTVTLGTAAATADFVVHAATLEIIKKR